MMFRKSLIMSITELENSMMTKKGKKNTCAKTKPYHQDTFQYCPFFFIFKNWASPIVDTKPKEMEEKKNSRVN
jgi:hypothetical protein